MATAYTPAEGLKVMAELIFKQANADRGSSLELGLFTNSSGLSASSVLADITEPTGGTYARIALTDASWTVDANALAEYAKQTFVAIGSAFSAPIYGFFIATTGTAPKLFHFQVESSSATVSENESYSVTPKIDLNAG